MYTVDNKTKAIYESILKDESIKDILKFIELDNENTIENQKELVLIESPTFQEGKRAEAYASILKDLGLCDVHIDKHGNVLGFYYGNKGGPTVLLEAHLDTVFPFGTVKEVIEKDGLLYAPGINDDTRGLAANLSVVRALKKLNSKLNGTVIVAGTIAEEGIGGMYGIKKLLEDNNQIKASISIDGSGCDSVVYEGTGIRNYEVIYTGPGGHAYGAFGTPNPIHAAGRAITKLSDMVPPTTPKTTFTVSLVEGGHQIHAIAEKASFKINMRSDRAVELDKLEKKAIDIFKQAAIEENQRWGIDAVKVEYEKIHDTPAGTQNKNSFIVQAAWQATKSLGIKPYLAQGGCTNTNMPIHMGIPAVTLGRGGREGGVHSLGEWFDPTGVYRCPQKSFLLILALLGLEGVCEGLLN